MAANLIRQIRAAFELVLRQYERYEDSARAEALAAKLQFGKTASFYADVKSQPGCRRKLLRSHDNIGGDSDISET